MSLHLILLTLFVKMVWVFPSPVPLSDSTSHIVIVTPQAQVHLETPLKYETPSTYIHHLSPLARLATSNEETIVYVPASAAAPIIPFDTVSIGGRSTDSQTKPLIAPKQFENIQVQIEQVGTALQQGAETLAPIIVAGAEQAGSAAAAAGSNLFPNLFPSPNQNAQASTNNNKEEIAKLTDIETPANTQALVASEARRFYSIAPVVPHVVDIVHAPVFLRPVGALRARSIQSSDNAVTLPLKLDDNSKAGPLQNALKDEPEIQSEKDKEFARAVQDANETPSQDNLKYNQITNENNAVTSISPDGSDVNSAEPIPKSSIAI